jgi:phosphate starvation-inducible PhoH-like protein
MAYLLHGSAGTGKSYMAIYFALKAVLEPDSIYKKIIIVRSTVQARQQGFLPGDIDEKMAPFEHPYVDICAELTNNKAAYEKLKETGKIEFMSTSFMRGETLRDAIVVFDETQNTTFQELSTVITRIGTGTKLFVLGDTKQDDLVQNKNDVSGFRDFINVTRLMEDFRSFKFTSDDIVRSPFVKSFIVACERLGL